MVDVSIVHVLLEGPDDAMFFESVLHDALAKKYDIIKTFRYVQSPKKDLEKYVKSLHAAKHDYIVLADFDVGSTCYSGRKERLRARIPHARCDNMAVVKTEIESWCLAGIGQPECRILRIPYHPNTESISKKEFERMRKDSRSASRIVFMKKILAMFDAERAKKQNASFEYVWDKFVSPRRDRHPASAETR